MEENIKKKKHLNNKINVCLNTLTFEQTVNWWYFIKELGIKNRG